MRQINKNGRRIRLFISLALGVMVGLFINQNDACAAKKATFTLVNPVSVTMGDAAGNQLTYRVRNANTGKDAGDSITTVEFQLNSPYTWSTPITAPTGWSAALSADRRTVTFTVTSNTIPPKIATNSTQDFILVLGAIPAGAQDSTDMLRSVKATYDDNKTWTMNNPASSAWTRKSLLINSFTAVDTLTGLQASSPGGSLTVTLTVTNRSTTNWTGIISVPQPPNAVIAWNSGTTTITTGSNPMLSLNAGQTGTLVWTFTIGSNCGGGNPPTGSVYFSITNLKNATNAVTSKSAISNTVAIGCFTGVIALSSYSISSGTNVTVTMTLRNGFGNSITGVAAALVPGGTTTKALVSGPTYTSTTIPAGVAMTWTWVYTITGAATDTYSFTGTATGIVSGKAVSATVNPSLIGSIISPLTVSVSTSATADQYKTVSVAWDFTNTQPNPIKKVEITLPSADWIFGNGSSLTNYLGTEYDDWTVSISGPVVTFAPGVNNIGIGNTGNFVIIFSDIPASQADYTFPVTLTEAATGDPITSVTTTVNVGAAGTAITTPGIWKDVVY